MSSSSSILAATLHIPPNPLIAFLILVPQHLDLLHSTRPNIPDNLLYSVQLGHRPTLYLFSLISTSQALSITATLDALRFEGFAASQPASHFSFQNLSLQACHIQSHFLAALRNRLVHNIVASSSALLLLLPCTHGFLICHSPPPTDDWGTSWQYKSLSRPLIFCHIQLLPTTDAILIRPTLLPTPYLPLSSSLPLLPRSPILLLPYATPAYFLTTYSGPTSALLRQFTDALGYPLTDSSFIIGWISVENRQGEEKGITFIYPTRLCLAFVPALNRSLLDYTPDLPTPLQPSPKLLSASTPLSDSPPTVTYPHRPTLFSSPTTQLQTFRALSLSKSRNIRTVADQVSSYVDHVAKDRERERERLKREREGGTTLSPNLLHRTTPSVSSSAVPTSTTTTTTTTTAPPHTPTPTPANTQNFYPSPPQADSSSSTTTNATIIAPLAGNTSPVLSVAPQPPTSHPPPPATTPTQAPPLTASSSSSSYDPFGYLGMNNYDIGMDFGMDMDMNFGINMGMNLGGNSSSNSTGAGNRSTYNNTNNDHDHGTSRGIHGSSAMDFEDFTDDDFNFFDQPSTHVPVVAAAVPLLAASAVSPINPLQITSPSPLFGDVHLSGPGPPHATPHSHPTPATTHGSGGGGGGGGGGPWSSNFPEGFTPRSVEHMDSVIPPERLISCTPGPTPLNNANATTDGGPVSPNVHLEHDIPPLQPSALTVDEPLKNFFDPIPFARYHRVSDGKYAPSGKFGLPSPPPDNDDLPPPPPPPVQSHLTHRRKRHPGIRYTPFTKHLIPSTNGSATTSPSTWRPRYDAITDPRVGVMRKLIGVKRKHAKQGGRTPTISWSPTEHDEEWEVHRSSGDGEVKDVESEPSEDEASQSEDGISQVGDEEEEEEEETPLTSRPITPPPSYLPLGPSLIHTQFHHTHLLPLSKPLRPPGSSIISGGPGALLHNGSLAVTTPIAPIANVPTPVSPAAGLGLSAEKWRALEVVVNVLAKEAVENVVWWDTWMAYNSLGSCKTFGGSGDSSSNHTTSGSGAEGKKFTEIWVSDVRLVEKVLAGLEGVHAGLNAADILGSVPLSPPDNSDSHTRKKTLTPQIQNTPKLSVGKGEAVINVLPTALRFWEKLGLGPKNGGKDGIVFVLFSDDVGDQHRHGEVVSWLSGVCTAYETRHLGKLKLGSIPTYGVKDGLVPLRFDLSFRKFFATFASNLSNVSTPILLFLVIPVTFMSLSSTHFRQILSTIQKTLKTLPESRVIIQMIPEHTISYIETDPASTNQLESFCVNLYNRIPVPVEQPLARIFSPDSTPIIVKAYLQKAIFTLARPSCFNKVTYTRSIHASLDVLDRYTILHVGYKLSNCGKWVIAACVDQRGEAWDSAVWLIKNTEQQEGENEVGTTTGSGSSSGAAGSTGGATTPGPSTTSGGVGGTSATSHEESFVVKRVWEFAIGFARRADVEWRIVISKLGTMDEAELTAWTTILPVLVPTSSLRSAVHVSLVCADPDSPWLFTKLNTDLLLPHTSQQGPGGGTGASASTNRSPPHSTKPNLFSDNSSTTYAFFPSVTLPISIPPTQTELGLGLPYVADPSSVGGNLGVDDDSDKNTMGVTSPTTTTPAANISPNNASSSCSGTAATPTSPISPSSSSSAASGSIPHPVGLMPKSTSCLVRIPRLAPITSISMLHIHVLWTYCYPASLARKQQSALELKTVHADVTKNFYELSVLAQARWRMAAPENGTSAGNAAAGAAPGGGVSGGGLGTGIRMGINPILPLHLAMVDIMTQVTEGADEVEIDS